jgi:putative transport protein
MELLHAFFQKIPMAALFLSVAIGYWVGKFQLGGMAGTLLAAVVIGQVGVPVDAEVRFLTESDRLTPNSDSLV